MPGAVEAPEHPQHIKPPAEVHHVPLGGPERLVHQLVPDTAVNARGTCKMLLVSVLQDLGEQALEESIGVVSMGHYLLHPIPQSGEPLLSKPGPKMHVAEELPKDQSWHPLASCDGIPGVIPDAMTRVRQRDHMQVEVMDHEEQGTPSNGPLINAQAA